MRCLAQHLANTLNQGNGSGMRGTDSVTQRRLTSMTEVTGTGSDVFVGWEQHRLKNVWTLRSNPEDLAGHIVQSFIRRPHIKDGFLSLDHQFSIRAVFTLRGHLALSGDTVNHDN